MKIELITEGTNAQHYYLFVDQQPAVQIIENSILHPFKKEPLSDEGEFLVKIDDELIYRGHAEWLDSLKTAIEYTAKAEMLVEVPTT